MTPLLPQLLKSAAIVAGAGIVLHRFSWREYPALLTWLLWKVAMQTATLGLAGIHPALSLIEDGICLAVVCEVVRSSRLDVGLSGQVRFLVCALATAQLLSSVPEFTPEQRWYLFRSYFLWVSFAVMAGITLRRLVFAKPERTASKIYRIGMTAWLLVLAVSGSFVRGGIGYLLFPRTMRTWSAVHMFSCSATAVVVIVMCAAMAHSVKGRKRAAKNRKGQTVCGLIEVQKVA